LSSFTKYFSTEFNLYLPENPPRTNTAPLQRLIAWAFLLSFIGALAMISFFKDMNSLVSLFGGEPPPVMRISVGERDIAAEH
jgi:hypothetical protein